MTNAVYTIGHSNHSTGKFIELLKRHSITAVGDVRSRPYSRMNPQFDRETLKESLQSAGIKYVFLGKELGARPEDKNCYLEGKVQYDFLAQAASFRKGIERVKTGARTYRIALMCAEKEPLDCHRTILVARQLVEQGVSVKHILASGKIEEHRHAIERLITKLGITEDDMFRAGSEVIVEAYKRQGDKIAYDREATGSIGADQMSGRGLSRTAG